MPIYLIETTKGKRIVQADTQKSAINFVMRSEVKIEPLNAVHLANVLRSENLEIEQVAKSSVEEEAEDAE